MSASARPDDSIANSWEWPRHLGPAILVGIVGLALIVRFWGLDWQLPFAMHPDEGHYVWKAEEMLRDGNLNPKYFRNPTLFTYVVLGEFQVLSLFGLLQPRADIVSGPFSVPSIFMYAGRAGSALLGVLTVIAVYTLGRRWVSSAVGLVAASLLAINFLHVRDSHYATNDVPSVALAALCVWLCVRAYQHPTIGAFAVAGLLGGLATSMKYSMGLFVLPLVLSCVLARWTGVSARLPSRVGALLGLTLAGLSSALGYLAGTPFTLLTWDKFITDFRVQMRLGAEGWEGQSSASVPQLYLDTLLTGVGWPLIMLASVGVILACRRDWRLGLILVSFPLGYGLFMARQQLFFARFAIPLLPFFALFGAYAVVDVSSRLRGITANLAAAVLIAVATAPSVYSVWIHNSLVSQPDTRVVAFSWMRQQLPQGAKIAIEDYTIRDRRPKGYLDDGRSFDTDLINVNDIRDPATILRSSYDYVVTSSFIEDRFMSDSTRFPRQAAFYTALDRKGRLVAEFRPGKGDTNIPFDIEDLYTPFWDVQRYERMGPTVRVYQLR